MRRRKKVPIKLRSKLFDAIYLFIYSFVFLFQNVVEETSRGLHRLTGSGGFESVKVIFPSSWRMDLCGVRVNQAPQPIAGPPHDADFSIGSQGFRALSGSPSGPWAEQHGGCGVEGLRVHVPINFFKDSPRFDAKMKGSITEPKFVFPTYSFSPSKVKLFFLSIDTG